MSEQRFQQAKGGLAFSQSLLDRFRQQSQTEQPMQQTMDTGVADTTPQQVEQPAAPAPAPQVSYRGVPVSDEERGQLKKAIFSEVSNRQNPIEVSAMTNVAFNRATANKKGLGEVVNDPKFFQGITNKRYSEVPQGEDAQVMDFVGKEVDKQLNDNAPDHTIGATHFVHITSGDKKGSLVTMTEKEFAKYLGKKDGQRDAYAESLLD